MTRLASIASLLVCLAASPALAELVVFQDGRVVKAASYKVIEGEVEIVRTNPIQLAIPMNT